MDGRTMDATEREMGARSEGSWWRVLEADRAARLHDIRTEHQYEQICTPQNACTIRLSLYNVVMLHHSARWNGQTRWQNFCQTLIAM